MDEPKPEKPLPKKGMPKQAASPVRSKRIGAPKHRNSAAGYVVLGIGILSVLMVGFLVLAKTYRPPAPAPFVMAEGSAGTEASAGSRDVERPLVSPADFDGSWVADLPAGRAMIVIGQGAYQIILEPSDIPHFRQFSRGVIYADGGSLVLDPRAEFGEPDNPKMEYTYFTLTMRPYAIVPERRGDKMRWHKGTAGSIADRTDRDGHPLFASASGEEILWERVP